MKYAVKDITIIALTSALTVVIGYAFYLAGSLFPLPGYKFVIFAPFLSFMLYIPVAKVCKLGTISAVSFIFAILMLPVTIFMSLAIFMSGICSDLLTLLFIRKYQTSLRIVISVAFYPLFSLLWAFFVANYFTGNAMYIITGGLFPVIVLCIIVYILGLLGGNLSRKFVYRRIFKKDFDSTNNNIISRQI